MRWSKFTFLAVSFSVISIGLFVVLCGGFANAKQSSYCIQRTANFFSCIQEPQKTVFVTKCFENNNRSDQCSCTYDALDELPEDYKKLATTWALKDDKSIYLEVANIFGIPAKGFLEFKNDFYKLRKTTYKKSTSNRIKKIKPTVFKDLLFLIRKHAIGWRLDKAARNATIGGVIVNAVPFVQRATNAKIVIDNYCGGSARRFYPIIKKIERSEIYVQNISLKVKIKAVKAINRTKNYLSSTWRLAKEKTINAKNWLREKNE